MLQVSIFPATKAPVELSAQVLQSYFICVFVVWKKGFTSIPSVLKILSIIFLISQNTYQSLKFLFKFFFSLKLPYSICLHIPCESFNAYQSLILTCFLGWEYLVEDLLTLFLYFINYITVTGKFNLFLAVQFDACQRCYN